MTSCLTHAPQQSEDATEEEMKGRYCGFGSFHSDNVEDLIALSEEEYARRRQPLPEFAQDLGLRLLRSNELDAKPGQQTQRQKQQQQQELGLPMQTFFKMDNSWTFINHGAFGGALRGAVALRRDWEDMMEAQLLTFVDRKLLPLMVECIRALGKFLHCAPDEIALVPNATFGLNAAIGMIRRHDVVCYLDSEYGSVYKMMRERCTVVRASLHEIPMHKFLHDKSLLGDSDKLTSYIEAQLPAGCTTMVLDHVASTSAIMLPIFTHLVPMLKRKGVTNIIIDGAHGPLQYPLDFNALREDQRPSCYVGNLHKWVSCPKSVGFIWCRKDVQPFVHSPVVSHGSLSGFLSEFIWHGTSDYGAYMTLPAVLDFWQRIGVDRVRDHCTKLLSNAMTYLETSFGSEPVANHAPFMGLVELPSFFNTETFSARSIQDTLHHRYKIEVPVKNVEGRLYLRLSAFVYNDLSEYKRLEFAIKELETEFKAKTKHSNNNKTRAQQETEKRGREEGAQEHHEQADGGCAQDAPLPKKSSAANGKDPGCGVGGIDAETAKTHLFTIESDEEED